MRAGQIADHSGPADGVEGGEPRQALRPEAANEASAVTGSLSSAPSLAPPLANNARSTFAAGALIGSRYRIDHFIAQGGMGEVYAAKDERLGEVLALKCLHRERFADREAVRRLKKELLLARRVTHRNVCRVHDLGVHRNESGSGEILFITMELIEGQSLKEHLAGEGPVPVDEALDMARQIGMGLAEAHAAGVIHRDLKPANVMLSGRNGANRRAVITDFGLARVAVGRGGSLASRGDAIVGTPLYMAPEQLLGEPATTASDIYAFGLVLCELITGRLPFAGTRPRELIRNRLAGAARPPRTFRSETPHHWQQAILACLQRNPNDRPRNIAAVLQMLEHRTDSSDETADAEAPAPEPGATPHASSAPRSANAEPRRRRAAWLAPLVALTVAGAAVAVLLGGHGFSLPIPRTDNSTADRLPPSPLPSPPSTAASVPPGHSDGQPAADSPPDIDFDMPLNELRAAGRVNACKGLPWPLLPADLGLSPVGSDGWVDVGRAKALGEAATVRAAVQIAGGNEALLRRYVGCLGALGALAQAARQELLTISGRFGTAPTGARPGNPGERRAAGGEHAALQQALVSHDIDGLWERAATAAGWTAPCVLDGSIDRIQCGGVSVVLSPQPRLRIGGTFWFGEN
ncbi:MAG: protein kinase [Candidatus Schekmanbacteria bacterium]|nr:protein kinase [Candidatus Schekmanbacteria bacterium]